MATLHDPAHATARRDGAVSPAPAPTGRVTRDDIIWSYRLILGRDPESDAVIDAYLTCPSTAELTRIFLRAPEFLNSGRAPSFHSFFSASNPPIVVECEPPEEQLARLVERVRRTWSSLGESKPHWSVLSNPEFLPDNINASREAFYASGAGEAGVLLATIQRVGRDPSEFATIHEFGCGLGRITNHLAKTFEKVIGCDISASHLRLAREHSAAIGARNISYREISMPDFGMHEPVDLWFSVIVLQHNPPPVMLTILRRVFSKLRPGGLAVFQVPTYETGYRFTVDDYLNTPAQEGTFDMHVLPQRVVFDLVRHADCHLLEIIEDARAGNTRWLSNTFVIGKSAASAKS